MEKQTKKTKVANKTLSFTEAELKNPMIRRAMGELVILRAGFHSTEPFLPISEAELEIMNMVSLFTPLKDYNSPTFPREVGKFKGKRVCLVD